MVVEALDRDGAGRLDIAGHRLRPVGEALVDPAELRAVLVVLEEMLVLVGEDALVQEGPTDGVRARVGRRRVRRVCTGQVEPVERVDGHDVPVEELVQAGREEAGDPREALRVVQVVEVLVPNVVDERHDVVAVTRRIGREALQRRSRTARREVTAVAVRSDAEDIRLDRKHHVVELLCEVVHLGVRDRRANAVPAVAGEEVETRRGSAWQGTRHRARNPDLDVVPPRPEREALPVEAERVVEGEPDPLLADRRRVVHQLDAGAAEQLLPQRLVERLPLDLQVDDLAVGPRVRHAAAVEVRADVDQAAASLCLQVLAIPGRSGGANRDDSENGEGKDGQSRRAPTGPPADERSLRC